MNQEEINVHIGEVKTGSGVQVLSALLGSCVGIGILWPERNIYGLAHCLLPKSPGQKTPGGGKYVDEAIHSLLKRMSITLGDHEKVSAIVAGGGNMTKPIDTTAEKLVGYHNVKQAIEILSELNIKIIHDETGGTQGRKVEIQCSTGKFNIKNIPKPNAA